MRFTLARCRREGRPTPALSRPMSSAVHLLGGLDKSLRRIFSLARFSCGFHVDTRTVIYVHHGIAVSTCFWRRERDSNPRRAFDPYTLSRGAPSTTRPSLRGEENLSASATCCAGARRARGGNHTQTPACAAKRAGRCAFRPSAGRVRTPAPTRAPHRAPPVCCPRPERSPLARRRGRPPVQRRHLRALRPGSGRSGRG